MILLEFIGTLLICTTMLVTRGNPIFIGLAHSTVLFIGQGKVNSHFSPLFVLFELFVRAAHHKTSKQTIRLV